jgi:hypothetical protein
LVPGICSFFFIAALLFEAGIMLGASSESLSYHATSSEEIWPYLQLERTVSVACYMTADSNFILSSFQSHVYLHHILRQLLKRQYVSLLAFPYNKYYIQLTLLQQFGCSRA